MSVGSDAVAAVQSNRRRTAVTAVGVLLLATTPFVTTAYVTEIVFFGLVYVLLGVSWNLLAGYAGQISLGHAAFFGIGAFVAAWTTTPGRAGFPEAIQLPVVGALLAGALAAALLSLVVGPIIFRLSGHYFAIGTLALAAIIQLVMLDQRQFTGGSTGYYVQRGYVEDVMFLVALAVTVLSVLAIYRVVDSPLGLGMRAIHDDEAAASSLGVHPLKYKMYAFVGSSSFVAGATGALYAQYTLYVNPESTLSVEWMIRTLVVVILGGMGTMLGPILGAGLFLGLDNALRYVAGDFATTVEGALIIVFVVFAPRGVWGLLQDHVLESDEGDGGSDADPAATESPD